jgi:hypothetical protein
MDTYNDPDDELVEELKASRAEMLKELRSLKRKARSAEFVGIAMVMLSAFALMDGKGPVGPPIGWMGLGLLFSILGVGYKVYHASLPTTRMALDGLARALEHAQR